MTHPYSIFIWHAPSGWKSEGYWEESVQVAYQEYALYLVFLLIQTGLSVTFDIGGEIDFHAGIQRIYA